MNSRRRPLRLSSKYELVAIFCAVLFVTATGSALAGTSTKPEKDTQGPSSQEGEKSSEAAEQTGASLLERLPPWVPRVMGMQFNGVYQYMPSFRSPYEGENSLKFEHGQNRDLTTTYGLYLGSQIAPGLQAYLDAELFKGNGISNGVGLGGFVNGDVIRAGSSNLPKDPYVARLYARYFYALSSETEEVERAMDQIKGQMPISRLEFKLGKMTPTDDMDQNRYANNNRTQFLNYDFLFNTAWDYASDTRGYSPGFVASLFQPKWKLTFSMFMEPNTPNGANYDLPNVRELGYNLEFGVSPKNAGTVVRVLVYYNRGKMGSYEEALAFGRETGTVPSLLDVEGIGRGTKYGFGISFEQPLADDGETGLFGRIGWNDGHHETWTYTEADRHVSLGAQVSGVRWNREKDRVGIAYGVNGLSSPHKDYLAAGGLGILLGDGRLNYGYEQVLEAYYRFQIWRYFQISPDFQFIQNPGYNRDRGPVQVYSIRLRASF